MKKIILILILVLSIVVPFTVSYAQSDETWLDPETEDVPTNSNTPAQDFDDGSQYEQNDDYIPATTQTTTQDDFYQDANDDSVDTNLSGQDDFYQDASDDSIDTDIDQRKTNTVTNGTVSGSGSNVSAKLQNPLKVNSIEAVILLAVDIMIYVGVSFAILALIFVGFKFVMAQGKPEEINKAKEWFLWIIIGLAVLISAKVIVEIVQNTLVKSGVVNQGFLKP